MAGGGMETLARLTSAVVASISACWPLRIDGVLERSLIEAWERLDSEETVRERGSRVLAIIYP